jgi:MFS family permease
MLSTRSARHVFGLSIVARLPLPMLSIGLLVHAERLTGSFAAAGFVAAVFAGSLGVGGPLLGRLADRHGQASVLLPSSVAAGAALAVTAALPAGVPLAVLAALAAALGLTVPPVGACLRALLPGLVRDDAVDAAYATEATAVELTFIAGPPLVLLVGAAWSTGAALAAAAVLLVAATAAFAAHPASRAWRPAPLVGRPRGGSLHSAGMRTLVLALVAVGVAFGATEVAVAATADALGATAAAGPLLGVWGAGSLIGGLVAARSARGTSLALLLAALAAGHLALAAATGSVIALAAVLALAGATIAPTYACVYAMVEDVAPAGTVTEAFAWLATAAAIGSCVGAAVAGALADAAGPTSTFLLAGGAGAVAAIVTVLRTRTLAATACPQPAAG